MGKNVSFSDLCDVDFASLGTAVGEWEDLATDFKRLASDARDGLRHKSETAGWAGANADVTRPFVRKIADEVGDLRGEAASIWQVLKDAHGELKALQSEATEKAEAARKRGIVVADAGGGTVRCSFSAEQAREACSQADYDAMAELEARLNWLLGKANEIDDSAARALRKSHGGDAHDAGHARYTSLDDAQSEQAISLARESLAAQAKGEDLSPAKLARLAEVLKFNAKDAEFATSFYRELGPKEALRFQVQLAVDASGGEGTSLKLARSIQHSMGTALATATHEPPASAGPGGDRTHLGDAWVRELKRVGRQEIPTGNVDEISPSSVLGYQALGNVLRHGTYDADFLNTVGEDMVAFEREHPGGPSIWERPDDLHAGDRLNLDKGGGAGYEPMTGLMEAMGRSPEASTEFFGDGGTRGGDSGLKRVSNFDYFFGDEEGKGAREWPPDVEPAQRGAASRGDLESGRNALGHALESATTGRAWDSEEPSQPHTQEQAELFHRVVDRFGGHGPSQLIAPGGDLAPIADSLGNMSAEYMHDIQKAKAGADDSDLFHTFGRDANLYGIDGDRLDRFLHTVSQDPDANGAILHAQQAVSAEAIRDAMANPPADNSIAEAARRAAAPGAEVSAIATQGRSEAIAAADDRVQAAEDFNSGLDTTEKWTGRVVGMGVGKVPVVGEAAGWVAEDLRSSVFSHYRQDPEEVARAVDADREDFVENESKSAEASMRDATLNGAQQAGLDPADPRVRAATDDVVDEVEDKYESVD